MLGFNYKRILVFFSLLEQITLEGIWIYSPKPMTTTALKGSKSLTYHISYYLNEISGMWEHLYSSKNVNLLTFPACFLIPINLSNLNSKCSDLLDMRNLQEQVEKAFCFQNLFWPFTVWIDCSSDLKTFANSRPSA